MTEEEKYFPHQIAWLLLNKLEEFNEQPKLIEDISKKFSHLTEHTLYYKFAPLYEEAVKVFHEQGSFPDLTYLNTRFPEGRVIEYIKGAQISMPLYDKLRKQLDYEILIQDFNKKIGESNFIDLEACKEFSKKLADFSIKNAEIPIDLKEDWINSYETFAEQYHGISTGIKILDEQVGDLSGVVTVAAPSGNGKSTFALSLAYNIATEKDNNGNGRNVLYISYEMTKFQLLANLVSIESLHNSNVDKKLRATDIKEKKLTAEQKALYKECMESFLSKVGNSGGHIALYDNTSMSGCSTIEEFTACIEEYSDRLDKKFDVIFIDNVDSLKILDGERGQGEMEKMNTFITKLDSFSKTYMDGYGTTIVLLSQTNRDGFKKLRMMEDSGSQEISIDFTVLQQYSALYERATMVLILYSSALMRSNNQLKIMPVKLRNKALPTVPLTIFANWAHSYIGSFKPQSVINNDDITTDEEELINSMTVDNDGAEASLETDDIDSYELSFD